MYKKPWNLSPRLSFFPSSHTHTHNSLRNCNGNNNRNGNSTNANDLFYQHLTLSPYKNPSLPPQLCALTFLTLLSARIVALLLELVPILALRNANASERVRHAPAASSWTAIMTGSAKSATRTAAWLEPMTMSRTKFELATSVTNSKKIVHH